jgi:hypothetical protein
MRYLRRKLILPAILSSLVLTGTAASRAADPVDVRLTTEARQSLNADENLASLNLGVMVKAGIATLFGPIPSEELSRRAEARVRVVTGMQNVRNELHVAEPDFRDLRRHLKSVEKADSAHQKVPEPILVLDPTGSMLSPTRHVQPPPVSTMFSLTRSDPAPATIAPAPVDPSGEIERLRRRDKRFTHLNATCSSGVVTISGSLKNWPDLWEFADALAKLPGIDRIRIENVRRE